MHCFVIFKDTDRELFVFTGQWIIFPFQGIKNFLSNKSLSGLFALLLHERQTIREIIFIKDCNACHAMNWVYITFVRLKCCIIELHEYKPSTFSFEVCRLFIGKSYHRSIQSSQIVPPVVESEVKIKPIGPRSLCLHICWEGLIDWMDFSYLDMLWWLFIDNFMIFMMRSITWDLTVPYTLIGNSGYNRNKGDSNKDDFNLLMKLGSTK